MPPDILDAARNVGLSAEGMIRNFGRAALVEAEKNVGRHQGNPQGREFWSAVVQEIRAKQTA